MSFVKTANISAGKKASSVYKQGGKCTNETILMGKLMFLFYNAGFDKLLESFQTFSFCFSFPFFAIMVLEVFITELLHDKGRNL